MNERKKPFPYDAVETPAAVIFIIEDQGADGRAATDMTVIPKGVQITRADGVLLRMIHLHPMLRKALETKPTFVIELGANSWNAYSANPHIKLNPSALTNFFPEFFYWYMGPETASVEDVARRPLARLFKSQFRHPVAIAPGQGLNGPLIGLCHSASILALARNRSWTAASKGVIVDAGLALGTTGGFPANDNIEQSVRAAHADSDTMPAIRPRMSWSSQVGMAFTP